MSMKEELKVIGQVTRNLKALKSKEARNRVLNYILNANAEEAFQETFEKVLSIPTKTDSLDTVAMPQ